MEARRGCRSCHRTHQCGQRSSNASQSSRTPNHGATVLPVAGMSLKRRDHCSRSAFRIRPPRRHLAPICACEEITTDAKLIRSQTRCLSELNLRAAQQRAREIDSHWRQHRCPIGPLHGLPVSLMDRFHVGGLDSACGFASWVGTTRTSQDEGGMVHSLSQLGAVIFCKTNVPMSMMVDLCFSFCYCPSPG